LAGLQVLLVEDEMLVSMLLEEFLADEGCAIVGPYSRVGPALAAATSEKIDLAVLDVNVAGVMVYPVAEALVARGIPFLFLSGYGAQAIPENRPNWRVCSKPFLATNLATMLVAELRRSAETNVAGRQRSSLKI
jgi:DNA-binding response OmpR family regulator